MNITTDPNLWVICALVFVLGLLIGVFLTAGGRRKWKTRYNERSRRRASSRKRMRARARLRRRARRNGASAIQPARRRRSRTTAATACVDDRRQL